MKTQNENTVTVYTASNIAHGIIASTLEDSRTLGVHWPLDAEFCVVQKSKAWPSGFDHTSFVSFYRNEAELKEKLRATSEFYMMGDNDYARRVYRWDLGPEEISELAFNEHLIPTGSEGISTSMHTISCGDYAAENHRANETMGFHRRASWPKRMKRDALDVHGSINFETDSLESIAAKFAALRK
jgi:hypothetical protein